MPAVSQLHDTQVLSCPAPARRVVFDILWLLKDLIESDVSALLEILQS